MYSLANMQELHEIRQLEQSIREDHRVFLSMQSFTTSLEGLTNITDPLTPMQLQCLQQAARAVGSQIQGGLGLEALSDLSVEQLLTISTEGVKETIAKLWEKAKELFAKIWKMLKDMMAKVQSWLSKNDYKVVAENLRRYAAENPEAMIDIKLPDLVVYADIGHFDGFSRYESEYIKRMTTRSYLVGEMEGIAKRVTATNFDPASDFPFLYQHSEALAKRWHDTGSKIGSYATYRLVTHFNPKADSIKPEKILSYLNQALSTGGEHMTADKNVGKREIKVSIDALIHGLQDVEHFHAKVEKESEWLNKKLDESGRLIDASLKSVDGGSAAAKLETIMGLLALHRKVDGAMIQDLGREGHVIRAISDVIRHAIGPADTSDNEE